MEVLWSVVAEYILIDHLEVSTHDILLIGGVM